MHIHSGWPTQVEAVDAQGRSIRPIGLTQVNQSGSGASLSRVGLWSNLLRSASSAVDKGSAGRVLTSRDDLRDLALTREPSTGVFRSGLVPAFQVVAPAARQTRLM